MHSIVFSCFKKVSKEWNRLGTRDIEFLEVCEAARSVPVEKQHYEEHNRRDGSRMREGFQRQHLLQQLHHPYDSLTLFYPKRQLERVWREKKFNNKISFAKPKLLLFTYQIPRSRKSNHSDTHWQSHSTLAHKQSMISFDFSNPQLLGRPDNLNQKLSPSAFLLY